MKIEYFYVDCGSLNKCNYLDENDNKNDLFVRGLRDVYMIINMCFLTTYSTYLIHSFICSIPTFSSFLLCDLIAKVLILGLPN